jgi:hypothetical protein
MRSIRSIALLMILATLTGNSAFAQEKTDLGSNAALRYWAAFAQMRDSALTDEEVKRMNSILDGTAPYDDLLYKDLIEKNRPALDFMARATALPACDWGLDYQMGSETPIEYVQKAGILGHLNALYAFHELAAGDKDEAVRVLAAGVRFSHDVANGGTLIAALIAESLLLNHFRAIAFGLQAGGLSAAQRSVLQNALAQLGTDGLDWRSPIKRELEIHPALDSQASAALANVFRAYEGTLSNPAALPELQRLIASASRQVSTLPNLERVLQTRQRLTDNLREIRSLLR